MSLAPLPLLLAIPHRRMLDALGRDICLRVRIRDRFRLHGHIDQGEMDKWLLKSAVMDSFSFADQDNMAALWSLHCAPGGALQLFPKCGGGAGMYRCVVTNTSDEASTAGATLSVCSRKYGPRACAVVGGLAVMLGHNEARAMHTALQARGALTAAEAVAFFKTHGGKPSAAEVGALRG